MWSCLGWGWLRPQRRKGRLSLYFTRSRGETTERIPTGGPIQDKTGNLYGTTETLGSHGYGTAFKLEPGNALTVLHGFAGGTDGANPFVGLLPDSAGSLYGVTDAGGNTKCNPPYGCGLVFKLEKSGRTIVLHRFAGGRTDGCYPQSALIEDKLGNLYGTTSGCGASGLGTVFRLSKEGKETVLHSFAGGASDGSGPFYASLLMDEMGSLYGVTEGGGSTGCFGTGCGAVYRLSKAGTFTLLHSFSSGITDGCYPYGTLVKDKSGTLYGTTSGCGSDGAGTVWKLSKEGKETVLYSFVGAPTDGANPFAGVIMDANGNFYGETENGGSSNFGAVFELSKKGALTLLHSFTGSDGAYLFGGVIRDTKGTLYGTTNGGGNTNCNAPYGCGTVWKLTP